MSDFAIVDKYIFSPCFISDYSMDQPVAMMPNPIPCGRDLCIKEEKENTMSCYDDDCDCCASATAAVVTVSDESKQRSYLTSRINDLRYEKMNALEKQFNVNNPRPETLQEMSDWLKAGNYTVKDLDKNPNKVIHYWQDYFSWRTKPADEAGYDKAKKAWEVAQQVALDAAALAPIADAFATMKALESWTYTA
jgi:hypothetical protein